LRPLRDVVEKCGRARQVTDDSIIRNMSLVCWITNSSDTHSEQAIIIALSRQQWLQNAPQSYVLRKIPVLFASLMWEFIIYLFSNPVSRDILYSLQMTQNHIKYIRLIIRDIYL
jgi:hypothetical protein